MSGFHFYADGGEQFKSLSGLIKFNNGLFKSDKQAWVICNRVFTKIRVDDGSYQQHYNINVDIGDYIYIVEGIMSWTDYGSRSKIPVSWFFIADEFGIKKQFKLKFKGNLRDGAYPDPSRTELLWERPANVVLPEKKVAAPVVKADEPASEWIGKVGQRTVFKGKVLSVNEYQTTSRFHYYDSGVRIRTTVDVDGSVVVYWNSLADAAKGDSIEFVATVKDHTEYNGKKQTVVSRAAKVVVTKANKEEVVA